MGREGKDNRLKRPGGKPVPLGFVEDAAIGMSVTKLSAKYSLHWQAANNLVKSPAVQEEIARIQDRYRVETLAALEQAAPTAARRLVELAEQDKDPKVALEACKLLLGLQGHVVRERQEVTITSPQAAMSDDALEARLQALRAKHTPPVVITLATPDAGNIAAGAIDES